MTQDKAYQVADLLNSNMHVLESAIQKELKLNNPVRLHTHVESIRNNEAMIRIQSENLAGNTELLGAVGANLYTVFEIQTWGGIFIKDDDYKETDILWINPKISFEYVSGGRNGSDFMWDSLYFNVKTQAWKFGKRYISL